MKRGYVLLVALVALAFSPAAAAQTWSGTGDADPLVALALGDEAETVTATASGYEIDSVVVGDLAGAGGAAAITGVSPQNFVLTAVWSSDLAVVADGGYAMYGIQASVGGADFWSEPLIFMETADPLTAAYRDGEVTGVSGSGGVSFRMTRTGDTLTHEYTTPGTDTWNSLGSEVLSGGEETASMDLFAFTYIYAGAGFDAAGVAVLESLTLTLDGGAPPPEVSASISGPHTVATGTTPVVLTASAEGFDEDPAVTYEWDDASTGDTRTLVGLGDGAYEYSVVASGNVGGEAETAEAAFALWVGLATPLAGGLGLGLLAGACALAGAVSIRRKK